MQFGWKGLVRTIVLTATVTSAFWVMAGVWWMNRLPGVPARSPSTRTAAAPDAMRFAAAGVVPMQSPLGPAPVSPAASGGALTIPVAGVEPAELVDTFAEARAGGLRRHDAIDIMAPLGTPVVAAAPGRVEKLFVSKDGGNTVYQRSPDGRVIYYYAHLNRYAPGLAEGQVLRRGSPIGTVGSSGNANPAAPHLHFAVLLTRPEARWHEAATAVDPYPLLGGRAKSARRAGRDPSTDPAR